MPLTPLFNIFGRSPIKPLEMHIDTCHQCVKLLVPFFEAAIAEDWPLAEKYQTDIILAEQKADDMKTDMRLHLPESYFMPVSRSDILDLITRQDALANCAKDIAGMVVGRYLKLPIQIRDDFMAFLKQCIKASHQARTAINELDELLESGFRGTEVQIVEEMITKLNIIEHETDEMQIAIRRKLFQIEDVLQPVDVVFLYKVIQWTGDIADCAQTVGARLLILLAR